MTMTTVCACTVCQNGLWSTYAYRNLGLGVEGQGFEVWQKVIILFFATFVLHSHKLLVGGYRFLSGYDMA